MCVPSLPESPEGAREIIVDTLLFGEAIDVEVSAGEILSALTEAGYTVARLERVEVMPRDAAFFEPLYRIVASPVAPPVSREAQ